MHHTDELLIYGDSDAIKRTAAAHHGLVGRAFLEKLTHDGRDFCAMLEEVKALPLFAAEGGEGQDKRAAGRFALIGLSGELATDYGLTGWQEGEAINAAALAFNLWRSMRGKGNDERWQIAERLASFLERHGDGRFSDADATGEAQIRERAGWWRDTREGREYLLTAEAMREALKGFDLKRALDVLQELGALPEPGSDGKRARFFRIGGRGVKLYPINPDKLTGGEHGASESLLTSLKSGVSRVSGVQPCIHAAFERYPMNFAEVSGVSRSEVLAVPDTSDTSRNRQGYQRKAAPIVACTPDTSETPKTIDAEWETAIRAWLALIEETDPATIAEVIDRCQRDASAGLLHRAGGGGTAEA